MADYGGDTRFNALIKSASSQMQTDYESARVHAQAGDSQRSGHGGEAAWETFLRAWGPGWPIATRKYVVGPFGASNEVDLLVLRPDYPKHLQSQTDILIDGIAAAFSCKLTYRRADIREALAQKKRLLEIGGTRDSNVRDALCGPFPFGLLAQSSNLSGDEAHRVVTVQEAYQQESSEHVERPSEDLDALVIADTAFYKPLRMASGPKIPPPREHFSEMVFSTFAPMRSGLSQAGLPLMHLVHWLHAQLARDDLRGSAIAGLDTHFGDSEMQGTPRAWPRSVLPDHLHGDLLTSDGYSKVF